MKCLVNWPFHYLQDPDLVLLPLLLVEEVPLGVPRLRALLLRLLLDLLLDLALLLHPFFAFGLVLPEADQRAHQVAEHAAVSLKKKMNK